MAFSNSNSEQQDSNEAAKYRDFASGRLAVH